MTNEYKPLTDHEQDIMTLTDKVIALSEEYEVERKAFGQAKSDIDVLLAGQILGFLGTKKNLGIDMAYEMLIASYKQNNSTVAEELYKEMIRHENNYKALERIIDANASKVMAIQSIMKYKLEGEKGTRG